MAYEQSDSDYEQSAGTPYGEGETVGPDRDLDVDGELLTEEQSFEDMSSHLS